MLGLLDPVRAAPVRGTNGTPNEIRMTWKSRPRRSLLFVPGNDVRKLDRADTACADTVVLDLEDAVAASEKERAREEVSNRIRGAAFAASEVAVRINAPGTRDFEADVESVVSAGARLLMIPKAESALGMAAVSEAVSKIERSGDGGSVRFLALVESARGIAQLQSIGPGSSRLEGLCFGNADFALDMSLPDGDPSSGVVYQARCNLAIAAVAARVSPIDGVCLSVKDDAAFRAEASEAARLGFHGKLCIHPSQVPLANEIFSPSEGQIATARRIVEAWNAATIRGQGVFSLDGKMIDAPLVEVQKQVLERARGLEELPESRSEATESVSCDKTTSAS
jgi:citrate lyase subunit beta/citryl-CoA lyase